MPNYKQSTIAGEKWQRVVRVQINNPYNGVPSLMFVEEELMSIGDTVTSKLVDNLNLVFDPANPTHVALYDQLNALYVSARDTRDTQDSLQ